MGTETANPATNTTNARAALERFVVDNDDLLALESRIGKFNIFDALGIARAEIRHSNFLAFILDPAESHGQGQLFLKALLMDLLKAAPTELRPLSPIELDGTELRGVEVSREWKNIDVLIVCKEPRFAVVIENKVDSSEHSDQLSRYQQTMAEHHPGVSVLYAYLTPDGDEPSEEAWLPYTYADIHRVLERIRDTYQQAIGDEVRVFLDHYLSLLGTRFMNDEKLDELCQRIYKNHRLALDLIWERVGSPGSALLAEVVNLLQQDPHWHVFGHTSKGADFLPKSWLEWLPPIGDYLPFSANLRSKENRLVYVLWVGPLTVATPRSTIITKLREECPNCGFKSSKASKVEGIFNRVTAADSILEWSEDEEPNIDAVRDMIKKKIDELFTKFEKLAAVLKPLCVGSASGK